MKLKSYFSGTVEAAMELARRELGEEALLVHARPSTPETRYLGAYEVVFGVMPRAGAAFAEPFGSKGTEAFLEVPRKFMARAAWAGPNPTLAHRVAKGELLHQMFTTSADREKPATIHPNSPRTVALIGPPGAGKTTTLMKLAVRYGLQLRRALHIVSLDVHRVGAPDQLRSLGAILGVGCDVAATPVALEQVLGQHRDKDLLLLDTPGLGAGEVEGTRELAATLAVIPGVEIHLVLPASMKADDLRRTLDQFAVCRPTKLLFTRLDETQQYGSLISLAANSGLPVSYLTNGQHIPQDLKEATPEYLAGLVAGRRVHDSHNYAPGGVTGAETPPAFGMGGQVSHSDRPAAMGAAA